MNIPTYDALKRAIDPITKEEFYFAEKQNLRIPITASETELISVNEKEKDLIELDLETQFELTTLRNQTMHKLIDFEPRGLTAKELRASMMIGNWFAVPVGVEKFLKERHSNRLFKLWNFAERYADSDGWFYLSQKLQVDMFGISRRTCSYQMEFFEKMGWIDREVRPHAVTKYRMNGEGLGKLFFACKEENKAYFKDAKLLFREITKPKDKPQKEISLKDGLEKLLKQTGASRDELLAMLGAVEIKEHGVDFEAFDFDDTRTLEDYENHHEIIETELKGLIPQEIENEGENMQTNENLEHAKAMGEITRAEEYRVYNGIAREEVEFKANNPHIADKHPAFEVNDFSFANKLNMCRARIWLVLESLSEKKIIKFGNQTTSKNFTKYKILIDDAFKGEPTAEYLRDSTGQEKPIDFGACAGEESEAYVAIKSATQQIIDERLSQMSEEEIKSVQDFNQELQELADVPAVVSSDEDLREAKKEKILAKLIEFKNKVGARFRIPATDEKFKKYFDMRFPIAIQYLDLLMEERKIFYSIIEARREETGELETLIEFSILG